MERHKRLERKTELRADPAKTREWRERTAAHLPRASRKRRKEEKERTAFREFVLKYRPHCEARLPWCCTYISTEVNELQRGPAREDCWLEYDRVSSLCSGCHGWITGHPTWAYHHGHQLPHEQLLDDWSFGERLRSRFRLTPCVENCAVDHMDWRLR